MANTKTSLYYRSAKLFLEAGLGWKIREQKKSASRNFPFWNSSLLYTCVAELVKASDWKSDYTGSIPVAGTEINADVG